MKIRITRHVPTIPSPEVGKVYEVIKTTEGSQRMGGGIRFVMCEGQEVGVLWHECEIVKEDESE